jgi:hypothetical protein
MFSSYIKDGIPHPNIKILISTQVFRERTSPLPITYFLASDRLMTLHDGDSEKETTALRFSYLRDPSH